MKHILLIILLITITTACRKKSFVTIQAQNINNLSDGSAYAGMEYYVVESWIPGFQSKSKRIASGTLDANGKAVFEVKMHPKRGTNLNVSMPDNICYGSVSTSLKHEANNTINFKYATCGYVKIPTNNINCEGVDDKFRYIYQFENNPDIYIYRGFGDENGWFTNSGTIGCFNSPGFYDKVPSGNYTIEWIVERPSGTTTGTDTFTVTEGDTTTYLLEY